MWKEVVDVKKLKRFFMLISSLSLVVAIILCATIKKTDSISVQENIPVPKNEATISELESNSNSESDSYQIASRENDIIISEKEEKASKTDYISCFPEADKWKDNTYYDFVHAVFFIYDYDGYYLADQNSQNKYYLDPDCTEEIKKDDIKIISSNFIPGVNSYKECVHCYLLKNGCIAYIRQNQKPDFIPILDTSETDSTSEFSEATNMKKDRYYDFVKCVYSLYDDGCYLTDPNSNTFYADRNCSKVIANIATQKISSSYIPGFDPKMNLVHCYLLGNEQIAFVDVHEEAMIPKNFD